MTFFLLQVFDRDETGFVSSFAINRVLRNTGDMLTDEEAEHMFKKEFNNMSTYSIDKLSNDIAYKGQLR